MPSIIRAYDNKNQPIIPGRKRPVPRTYFNLLRLFKDETVSFSLADFESVAVVLSGTIDIVVNGIAFKEVGQRKDIWYGNADSVYIPTAAKVNVTARSSSAEIAVAGGRWTTPMEPFRIPPEEEVIVEVGSLETHSRRRICHILGKNTEGRTGNLLVSELYAEPGCWSGYPPHKHDEDLGDKETRFEEVYHYRFRPENGFGVQVVFQPNGKERLFRTLHGDTVLINKGYHPTVTSPGHAEYIFTILVGITTRSLVQNFKEEYHYLTKEIPGIDTMVNHFR